MDKYQKYKKDLLLINSELFQIIFLVYLAILLIESFEKGIISNFVDINWFLAIVIISGIVEILRDDKEAKSIYKKPSKLTYIGIIILGIIGGGLVFLKLQEMTHWLAVLISVLSGLIIILLSYLILNDEGQEDQNINKKIKNQEQTTKQNVKNVNLLGVCVCFIITFLIIFYLAVNFIGIWSFLLSLVISSLIVWFLFFR